MKRFFVQIKTAAREVFELEFLSTVEAFGCWKRNARRFEREPGMVQGVRMVRRETNGPKFREYTVHEIGKW